MLPFDREAFFALFGQMNLATWPAAPVAWALLAVALGLALRPPPWAGRAVAAILALVWAWNGIAYHWHHFATINFLAPAFAMVFVAQALVLAWTGLVRGRLRVGFRRDAAGWAGLAVALFGLAGYPLLGWLLGHRWPAIPLPGVAPCPTTMVTFGLLLLAQPRAPLHLLVLPLAWALIGGSAAFLLGVWQDLALPVAGLAALLLRGRRAAV